MKHHRRLALVLAMSLASAGVHAAEWVYTVRPGDNPWTLTERLLAGIKYWPRIQAHNHIADAEHIPPGTRLRIPVGWLRRTQVTATVAAVQGGAELLRTNVSAVCSLPTKYGVDVGPCGPSDASSSAARALRTGTVLITGDIVRTAEAGNVTVEFKDGSRMLVHAGSELRMADLATYENTDLVDTRVELVRGRTENLVQPLRGTPSRFEITTPSAVTSVRGTDYRVNAGADATRTEVLGGKVGVAAAAAKEVGVAAGFGAVTGGAAASGAPVPLLPPPSLEGLPAVVERVPIAFNVPTQAEAQAYRLQIAGPAGFQSPLFDGRSGTTLLRAIDLPDGDYRLRVRGIDARELEGRNADRDFTLNARPVPPLTSAPAPQAGVMAEKPVFEWASVSGISRYRLQIAQDEQFTAPVVDEAQLTETRYEPASALALGDWYWRVMAIDATEGAGPFGDARHFRRVPPAPQAASDVNDKELTLSWPAGLPGERYQVQIADEESFAQPLHTIDSAEPLARVPRPPGGTYYIRVRSIYPDGFEAPFDKPQTIEVPSSHKPWWLALPLLLFLL